MQPQEGRVRRWELSVRPGQAYPGPEERDGAQALAQDNNTALWATAMGFPLVRFHVHNQNTQLLVQISTAKLQKQTYVLRLHCAMYYFHIYPVGFF